MLRCQCPMQNAKDDVMGLAEVVQPLSAFAVAGLRSHAGEQSTAHGQNLTAVQWHKPQTQIATSQPCRSCCFLYTSLPFLGHHPATPNPKYAKTLLARFHPSSRFRRCILYIHVLLYNRPPQVRHVREPCNSPLPRPRLDLDDRDRCVQAPRQPHSLLHPHRALA